MANDKDNPVAPAVEDGVREALKPFAKIADQYDAKDADTDRTFRDELGRGAPPSSDITDIRVSLGDCRRARTALQSTTPPAASPGQVGEYERAHKVMTPEEYAKFNLKGWHQVCKDVDGFGGVGVRYDTATPPSPVDAKAHPDFVYDPTGWESTYEWGDRDEVHGFGDAIEPREFMRVNTLYHGPQMFVAHIAVTRDEAGDPDEMEYRWFNSEAEARAALDASGEK